VAGQKCVSEAKIEGFKDLACSGGGFVGGVVVD